METFPKSPKILFPMFFLSVISSTTFETTAGLFSKSGPLELSNAALSGAYVYNFGFNFSYSSRLYRLKYSRSVRARQSSSSIRGCITSYRTTKIIITKDAMLNPKTIHSVVSSSEALCLVIATSFYN